MLNNYLFDRISLLFKSKKTGRLIFGLAILILKTSTIPGLGTLNKILVQGLNPQFFGLVNGAAFSKKFQKCGTLPRLGKGSLIYYPQKIEIGDNVCLGNYVVLYNESNGGTIRIGNNTHISDFTLLSGVGGLEIGNNTAISSGVKIYSHSNDYKDTNRLMREQIKKGKVTIGNNVLIGANVVILPDIKINDNAVIGAGAVVTKDIPENKIAAGVPAIVIKDIHPSFNEGKNG